MRHAKSDWSNYSIPDFDRPLNKRGLNDAPLIGKAILKKSKKVDLIISSPANRAKTTAELMANTINYQSDIQFERKFYGGYIDDIQLIFEQINDNCNVVLSISHNPTIEELIYDYIETKKEIVMPTAGIASLLFNVDKWEDIQSGGAKLEWLIKPKQFK